VVELLRDTQTKAGVVLDEASRQFWALTKHMLGKHAKNFDDGTLSFELCLPPADGIPAGLHTFSKAEGAKGIPYRPNSPLGEWVIAAAKALPTDGEAEIAFDVTGYPMQLHDVAGLRGEGGMLRLDKLRVESLGNDDYLLFSSLRENGKPVTAETTASMFMLDATRAAAPAGDEGFLAALAANARQYEGATLEKAAEANNRHFQEETERIERWSRDKIAVAERGIAQAIEHKRSLENEIRRTHTLQEQEPLQRELNKAVKDLRRARQRLFDVEDETDERRNALLDALQRKLASRAQAEPLFTVRWKVV
jgi:hypothetical protein